MHPSIRTTPLVYLRPTALHKLNPCSMNKVVSRWFPPSSCLVEILLAYRSRPNPVSSCHSQFRLFPAWHSHPRLFPAWQVQNLAEKSSLETSLFSYQACSTSQQCPNTHKPGLLQLVARWFSPACLVRDCTLNTTFQLFTP